MALSFDPNARKKPSHNWASYVPDRTPQFKVHTGRGQAVNAVHYQRCSQPRGGIVYEWIDGKWVENYRYEKKDTCVKCGKPLGRTRYSAVSSFPAPPDREYAHWKCPT